MSLFSCLCFPNRKSKTHSENRRKWQNLSYPPSLTGQSTSRSKLIPQNEQDFYTATIKNDSWSNMENQPGVRKRRRLDEIFDRPKSEIIEASEDSKIRFQNVGYKCAVSGQVESMYGYTPRAVQDVFVSSALEGQSIEDYFNDCRNDTNLTNFASAEKCSSSLESMLDNVPNQSNVINKYIIDSEGVYSSDSDMESGDYKELFPEPKFRDDFQGNKNDSTPDIVVSPYMCQSEYRGFQSQQFEEIFGSAGEVLY